MKRLVPIPCGCAEHLKNTEETGFGYQVVSVQLKDGRIFEQVAISERRLHHRGPRIQGNSIFGRRCGIGERQSQALEFQGSVRHARENQGCNGLSREDSVATLLFPPNS